MPHCLCLRFFIGIVSNESLSLHQVLIKGVLRGAWTQPAVLLISVAKCALVSGLAKPARFQEKFLLKMGNTDTQVVVRIGFD